MTGHAESFWGCGALITEMRCLMVLIVVDHDAQNVERILSVVEKREEILRKCQILFMLSVPKYDD